MKRGRGLSMPVCVLAAGLGCAAAMFAPGPGRCAELTPNQISEEAYKAFSRSEWAAAVGGYEKLAATGAADPGLYYNLGTAYARSGDPGRAAWALLLARRMAPRDGDIRANLAHVSPNATAQIAVFPIPPLEFIYQLMTLNAWAWFGFASTLAACLALGFYLAPAGPAGSGRRRWARRSATYLFAAAGVGHFFAATRYATEVYKTPGVVIAKAAYPRTAPDEAAKTYEFTLPPGTVIEIGEAGAPGWIKAIYGGKNEVFIKREQMEYLRLPRAGAEK